MRDGAVDDDQTILRASPIYIRFAAIASCILSVIGVAVAAHTYAFLVNRSAVHHFGRWGETTESIESYLFGPSVIQIIIAVAVTVKWLRWSTDIQRAAAERKTTKLRILGYGNSILTSCIGFFA